MVALNIMVVDDSPVMRVFIRKVIALTGLEVGECWEAGNGEEALACLRSRPVNLVLTDINMPVMDGEEFVRRMGSEELLREIPVIVVSTDSNHSSIQRMLVLGARGYVAKPFLPEALRDEVEKILGASHA